MEKCIAIVNGQTVKEIEKPSISFRELVGGNPVKEIKVLSEKGETRIANLEDKISDYLETRKVDVNGVPRRYNCLELELRQKLNFNDYCKNTSCLIIDRKIFELTKNQENSMGKLNLLGETFHITEKDPNIEIEFDKQTLQDLMARNYFNYRGSLYELNEGEGEIELRGKQYKICYKKRENQARLGTLGIHTMSGPIKEYEVKYREIREVTIRRHYGK